MTRALHLVGSPTNDLYADLSRLYAADCLASVGTQDDVIAWIAPDRGWRFPVSLDRADLAAAEPVDLVTAIDVIAALHVDVAIPQMFCLPGMTTYRALLELLGIPYVGNRPDVMAVGADKARAKAVVAGEGVAVAHGEVLRRGNLPTAAVPAVVKPADADNSLGLGLVRAADDWSPALEAAFEHSDRVLVEEYVELGREVRCGTVELDGKLVCLPLEEYDVGPHKPVRDHADKIARDDSGELHLQAKDGVRAWMVDPSDPVTAAVHDAARRCHEALGCRDHGLFDFRVDPAGRPIFLEASLYCSYAKQSVITMMAAAAGIELTDLYASHISAAVARRDN